MDKIKVALFVKGNIIAESLVSWEGTDYVRAGVTPNLLEMRYDISDALIIDGDVRAGAMTCRDKAIIATGYIAAKERTTNIC